jgi:hypothetical protein
MKFHDPTYKDGLKASGFMRAACWDCYRIQHKACAARLVYDPFRDEMVAYATDQAREAVTLPTGEILRRGARNKRNSCARQNKV